METFMKNTPKHLEPRWPAMLALLAVGGLRLALPESLSVGPDWLLIAVVGVLLIPTAWARLRGLDDLTKILGYVLTSIVTVDMVWSLGLLVAALPLHKESPQDLLRSASALWITNVLVLAARCWRPPCPRTAWSPYRRSLSISTDDTPPPGKP